MAVTVPEAGGSAACLTASTQFPPTVAGRAAVATDPVAPAVHAWGDPAIIARCGVPEPGPTADQCLTVSGVDWIVQPLSDGTRFTTFGRSPALEVLIPKGYAPEPLLLPAFGPAAEALPTTGHHCS